MAARGKRSTAKPTPHDEAFEQGRVGMLRLLESWPASLEPEGGMPEAPDPDWELPTQFPQAQQVALPPRRPAELPSGDAA
jgi:hypothetical protein